MPFTIGRFNEARRYPADSQRANGCRGRRSSPTSGSAGFADERHSTLVERPCTAECLPELPASTERGHRLTAIAGEQAESVERDLMPSLLDLVLDANGGARFESMSTVMARVSFGGSFWGLKGQPTFGGTELVEAKTRTQWIRQTNVVSGRQVTFDRSKDLVTVTDRDGRVIEVLEEPRRSLDGYTTRTAWSVGQTAYSRSYATWSYLLEPFTFSSSASPSSDCSRPTDAPSPSATLPSRAGLTPAA